MRGFTDNPLAVRYVTKKMVKQENYLRRKRWHRAGACMTRNTEVKLIIECCRAPNMFEVKEAAPLKCAYNILFALAIGVIAFYFLCFCPT